MDCELCKRESKEKPAGFYCNDCEDRMCEDCSRHHRKSKLTLQHRLVDLHVSAAGGTENHESCCLKELNTYCSVHAGRAFEYLCLDHDDLCCPYCVIEKHRTCKKVMTFGEYKRSAEFANKGRQMQEMIKEVTRKADYVTQICQELIVQVTEKDKEFETWLQDVLSQIATKIKTICAGKMVFVDSRNLSVKTVETVEEEMKVKTLQETRELLETAKKYGSLQEEVVALNKMSNVLKLTDTAVKKGQKFVHSLSFRNVDLTLKPVFQAIEEHIRVEEVGLTTGEISFHSSTQINCAKFIRKCTFIADNILICLFDHENVAVAYNIKTKLINGSINLTSKPVGLARRSNNTMLITLPFSKQVVNLTVKGSKLTATYMDTETSFDCVAFCPSKGDEIFVATSKAKGNIYFITWEGKQLQEIETLAASSLLPDATFRNKIISYVDDISVHSKSGLIFASSTKLNRLLVFSPNGSFKCSFDLNNPMGVTNGPCDFMLACSYASHQINEIKIGSNTQNRIMLTHQDGLTGPLDVTYNSATRQLVICEMDKGRELKIFNVQLQF